VLNIYVADDIRLKIEEIPNELRLMLKKVLTLPNPAYEQALKYGNGCFTRVPKEIVLYSENEGFLNVPRGVANKIIYFLKQNNIPYQIHDQRAVFPEVNFESQIILRDYQKEAVNKLTQVTQGFLVSPCGSGKTVMMVELMTRIKQPTLFIVHQKELMDQIIQTAVNLTDVTKNEIGIIGNGKRTIGERMTVATIQTLNRMDINEIKGKFGAIFVDEAHHLAAKSFYEVISKFPAKYRLAVSATPERADGLSEMVYACSGPVIHEIKQSQVPTIIPSLKVIQTDFAPYTYEHMEVVKELVEDRARNQLIVDTIKKEAPGHYSLVLSDRVEHLEILKPMITRALPHLKVEILTGALKKTERNEIMQRAKSKDIDILLATQLAREGLDIPHLDRLFMTYPKKSAATVQQEIGRIMRPAEGKTDAIVFDFCDLKHDILKSQFYKRVKVYKKIGMTVRKEVFV
jgi:superfamily II DNA or RNA helicase